MYKVVVQVVLLYRREIWVMIDAIMMVIEGFSYNIDIRGAGIT